jgi:cytochrome d ubiquinol oxidase subunit II
MSGFDLPLIWAGIIAVSVLLYAVLDGFDLGVGILFPFARSREDRDVMMNTIAPVWDGNETWLILGGNALFAAFPLAFALLMPALYLPVLIMLIALILRGVAFEFRFRARERGRALWTVMFAGGSTLTAFAQGLILGGFIQGVRVGPDGRFAGGALDWLTPYAVLVAAGVTAGYALLGACWVILKTEDELHGDARRWGRWAGVMVAAFLGAVSLATLFVHPRVAERWGVEAGAAGLTVDWAQLGPLLLVPALGLIGFAVLEAGVRKRAHRQPFVGAMLIFLSGYIGLAVSFAPYVAPYAYTYEQAAAAPNALALLLAITGVILPLILAYTAWVYFIFRGKVGRDAGYHH